MHIKSTFIDYYYCYIADAMEIHPQTTEKNTERESGSEQTRLRERNVILRSARSISLSNENPREKYRLNFEMSKVIYEAKLQ